MLTTSRIEVDLTAVDRNAGVVREALAAGGGEAARLCAVVKADAYGLGAVRMAQRLEKSGVDMLAVYTLAEAVELLEASIRTPVLVMSPVESIADSDVLYRSVSFGRLHFTVHSREQAEAMNRQANRFGVEIPVHLDVNTGMNRGGAKPGEALEILDQVVRSRRLFLAGVSTHFASADVDAGYTKMQADVFRRFLDEAGERVGPKAILHGANTFAVFRSPGLHRRMARVGLALLGYAVEEMGDPDAFEFLGLAKRLTPAVRWTSHVAHLQWVEAGERVGYGGTWTAERPTRLALAPAGYADGYPLGLSSAGVVGVRTGEGLEWAPVVGRVSMDQITVDVTGLGDAVGVGTEVELITPDREAPNHLPELAHRAGTIAHDLLCRMGRRVPRRYLTERTHAGDAKPTVKLRGAQAPAANAG